MNIEKIVVHYADGETSTVYQDRITEWVETHVYLDSETKKRRTILLDPDRNRMFFMAEELDFDKDDVKKTRYWLDECEGWNPEWFDDVRARYTN
jgi:hypothetical protein